MSGYVRQDVTDQIANGNSIDAIPLDQEFDAITSAFANVGGHKHDGTIGEGAPITVVGPAQDVVVSGLSVTPKTDDTISLGSSTFEFKDLWIDGTANIDSLVADTADINAGTVDNTVIGATTPAAATFTSVVATTADINGGTIDSAVIGGAVPAAATVTTLTANSGTVGGAPITTNSNTQTLTNKTVDLTNNTLVATSAQLRTAVTDETGAGSLVFADSPALTGTPTAPTAPANTNTTQIATTAHVFAERTNPATLTNKTLTSPTINTPSISSPTITSPTITGGSISGITPLAVPDGGSGVGSITGIIKGNGTAPFSPAVAGTDYLSPADIGTTVQPFDSDLSSIASLSTNGLITRTGAGTAAIRTITSPSSLLSVSNGDGVSGNPTVSLVNGTEGQIIRAGASDLTWSGSIESLTTITAPPNITNASPAEFLGIPSWAKRLTLLMVNVNGTGSITPLIELGTSSGYETSGYDISSRNASGTISLNTTANSNPAANIPIAGVTATSQHNVRIVFEKMDGFSNSWFFTGTITNFVSSPSVYTDFTGIKSLSGPLTKIKIYVTSFAIDSGTFSLKYE